MLSGAFCAALGSYLQRRPLDRRPGGGGGWRRHGTRVRGDRDPPFAVIRLSWGSRSITHGDWSDAVLSAAGVRQLCQFAPRPWIRRRAVWHRIRSARCRNPLVWMGVLSIVFVAWLLYRTPFSLRTPGHWRTSRRRALCWHPGDASSLRRRRARAALAGLGGVYLALDQHQFSAER